MSFARILADGAFLASVILVAFAIDWLTSLCAGPRPLGDNAEDWGDHHRATLGQHEGPSA